MFDKIRIVQQLNKNEKLLIKVLEESCGRPEGIHYKLDPQALTGSAGCEHVLYEAQGALKGYVSVNCFSGEDMECTAIVDGKGDSENDIIFAGMYKAVMERAGEKGIQKLLFIVDRNDIMTASRLKQLGFCFAYTEYRMVFNPSGFKPDEHKSDIELRDADPDDIEIIAYLDNCADPNDQGGAELTEPEPRDIRHIKIARLNNEAIGKVKVEDIDATIGIYGFVVNPSRRGEGLGRKILNQVIKDVTETGYKKLYLEVDSENHLALNLYKSTGFDIQAMFDYYEYSIESIR